MKCRVDGNKCQQVGYKRKVIGELFCFGNAELEVAGHQEGKRGNALMLRRGKWYPWEAAVHEGGGHTHTKGLVHAEYSI